MKRRDSQTNWDEGWSLIDQWWEREREGWWGGFVLLSLPLSLTSSSSKSSWPLWWRGCSHAWRPLQDRAAPLTCTPSQLSCDKGGGLKRTPLRWPPLSGWADESSSLGSAAGAAPESAEHRDVHPTQLQMSPETRSFLNNTGLSRQWLKINRSLHYLYFCHYCKQTNILLNIYIINVYLMKNVLYFLWNQILVYLINQNLNFQ